MSQSVGGLSSDQTLKRIQEETQRLRRRLTEEDLSLPDRGSMTSPPKQGRPEGVENAPSIELSTSGRPFEQIGTPTSGYADESSSSHTFKDPVPPSATSAHLRSEHEAFKQR